MFKFTIFFILAFLGLCQAKPGLFDLFSGSECKPIADADTCAIVYDDEDCEEGDWDPLRLPGNGLAQSFSTLTLNPFKALKNLINYKDDIESLVVRKGCVLEVFQESDCTGAKYTFRAESDEDLIVEELDESDAEDFDETIECVRCTCPSQQDFSKTNFAPGPPRPATCQDIPLPYGAITWDDGDCILDDWDTPVALRPGEERQWNLLSNPSEYAEYANTIESLCVRRGCNLTVYDDGDFSDDPFSFVAKDFDLCVTLDSPPSFYSASERSIIKGLDDSIRSMTLKCNNRPSTLYTEY